MSKRKQILFSWIGHADIAAMSYSLKSNDSLSPEQWQQLKEQLGRKLNDNIPKNLTPGPIRILLNQKESFNEIHLLSDFPAELNKLYGEWLNRDVCIHDCKLSDPTNYRDVFIATNDYIAGVYNDIPSNKKDTVDFHFFLTSGTSTMTAIWVLLGKSQFPATGRMVSDAITPAKCAAAPAQAITTSTPRLSSF